MTAMKPQNSNAEILRVVLLGALLYFHDLSISISHNSYFSVPTKEKRQKSQAKTLRFILNCKSNEVRYIKLQKIKLQRLSNNMLDHVFCPSYTKRLCFCGLLQTMSVGHHLNIGTERSSYFNHLHSRRLYVFR
jgi:hypothetical protein